MLLVFFWFSVYCRHKRKTHKNEQQTKFIGGFPPTVTFVSTYTGDRVVEEEICRSKFDMFHHSPVAGFDVTSEENSWYVSLEIMDNLTSFSPYHLETWLSCFAFLFTCHCRLCVHDVW